MIYEQQEKAKGDSFHDSVVADVRFKDSKAFQAFLDRAARLGIDATAAEKMISPPSQSTI